MRYLIFLIMPVMFFSSCKRTGKEHRRLFTQPILFVDSVVFKQKLNLAGYNFYGLSPISMVHNGKPVFCFLSGTGSIHLLDAETFEIKDSLLLPPCTRKAKLYLRNDSLFIYEHPSHYTLCVLHGREFKIIDKVKAPHMESKYFVEPYASIFADKQIPANIIFSYGHSELNDNSYLDTATNILRFSDSTGYKKEGYFPGDFFSQKHYYNATLLNIDTAGNLVFGYEESDSIFKMNAQGKIIAASAIESNGDGKPFDWKKETNLAYIRRYTWGAELNKAVHISKNNYTVVLKKLHEEDISRPWMFRYLVFDDKLKLKYADSIKHSINPNFIFNYKKGIAFLSLEADKIYYYEIP